MGKMIDRFVVIAGLVTFISACSSSTTGGGTPNTGKTGAGADSGASETGAGGGGGGGGGIGTSCSQTDPSGTSCTTTDPCQVECDCGGSTVTSGSCVNKVCASAKDTCDQACANSSGTYSGTYCFVGTTSASGSGT